MVVHARASWPTHYENDYRPYTTKRILLGIMSSALPYYELEIRQQFRELFQTFPQYHDHRVCAIHDFLTDPRTNQPCELIYTFVLGGLPKHKPGTKNIRTELVNNTLPVLIQLDHRLVHFNQTIPDAWTNDMTILNIHENMKEGKSQTWLYYAHQLLQQNSIEYVAKADSDAILDLPKLFQFVNEYLPPFPYNRGIIAGKPCDKLWWRSWRQSPATYPKPIKEAKEGYFMDRYGHVAGRRLIFHVYALGQCYILSPDLVATVVSEASSGRHRAYIEGNEDHDISTMALHSSEPIHFIYLSEQDMQFWQHPVKLDKTSREQWEQAWIRAKANLAGYFAEGMVISSNQSTKHSKTHL